METRTVAFWKAKQNKWNEIVEHDIHVRDGNDDSSSRLMSNAFEELLAFQRALKDVVASVDATYAKQYEEFFIGLEGSFGTKHVTPRTLTSRLLSSMVCVEGIITKCKFKFISLVMHWLL